VRKLILSSPSPRATETFTTGRPHNPRVASTSGGDGKDLDEFALDTVKMFARDSEAAGYRLSQRRLDGGGARWWRCSMVEVLDGGGAAALLVPRRHDNREQRERAGRLRFRRGGQFYSSRFQTGRLAARARLASIKRCKRRNIL